MKLLPARFAVPGLVALLQAATAQAVGLGAAQGTAVLGQPLQLRVPLRLDSPDEQVCGQARLSYGDTEVAGGRVTTAVQGSGADAAIVVRSTVPVDEPFVTLELHVGCSSRVTRRYVLLSEQSRDAVQPPARLPALPVLPALPAAGASVPARPAARSPAPAGASAAAAAPATATAPSAGATPRAAAPAAPAGPRPAARSTPPRREAAGATAPARAEARPRLRLEPVDPLFEPEPKLRLTDSMLVVNEATPQERANAAAIWRGLTAAPLEFLRSAERIAAQDAELQALRQDRKRQEAALAQAEADLRRAQGERYANPLVYGLAALLAAALVGLVLLVLRGRENRWRPATEGRRWWQQDAASAAAMSGPTSLPSAWSEPPETAAPAPAADPRRRFGDPAATTAPVPIPAGASAPAALEMVDEDISFDAATASLRAITTEELDDVQQHADFFVSLGQHDRAIQVLRSHIESSPETSPLAWLDLLAIYRDQERLVEYERVREDFTRRFHVKVPSYEDYRAQLRGLESYPKALTRIVALWPSPKVLEVIEETIFRKPDAASGDGFSLEAYRELLLLHRIGKDVLRTLADEPPPEPRMTTFSDTNMSPLSLSPDSRSPLEEPGGPVDVDLDALSPPSDWGELLKELKYPDPPKDR